MHFTVLERRDEKYRSFRQVLVHNPGVSSLIRKRQDAVSLGLNHHKLTIGLEHSRNDWPFIRPRATFCYSLWTYKKMKELCT